MTLNFVLIALLPGGEFARSLCVVLSAPPLISLIFSSGDLSRWLEYVCGQCMFRLLGKKEAYGFSLLPGV